MKIRKFEDEINTVFASFSMGDFSKGYRVLLKLYNRLDSINNVEEKRMVLYNMAFVEDSFARDLENSDTETSMRYKSEAEKHIKMIKDIIEAEENEWYVNRHKEKYINVLSNYRHICGNSLTKEENVSICKKVYDYYRELNKESLDYYMVMHNYFLSKKLHSRCLSVLQKMIKFEYDNEMVNDILADLKENSRSAYIQALQMIENFKRENSLQIVED